MSPEQRSALAKRNGRRGGLARVAKLRAIWGGDPLKRNMLRSMDVQKIVYGHPIFANHPNVKENHERQRRACSAAGKRGGVESGKSRRRKRDLRIADQYASTQLSQGIA
jgi:hypothetical protein